MFAQLPVELMDQQMDYHQHQGPFSFENQYDGKSLLFLSFRFFSTNEWMTDVQRILWFIQIDQGDIYFCQWLVFAHIHSLDFF